MLDAYQDRLDYLYGRLNYETVGMPPASTDLRLGRMRRLLRRLDDPQRSLRIIHVAGTKGKGSTAVMLAAALTAGGRRTGLYSSPHLHRLEERYQVDGTPATAGELVDLADEVRTAVEAMEASDSSFRLHGATFFEITTAMGLLHFARKGTDVVVLEVGMGGRLDSTNVVHPVLAVITSIALDHTRQLGNTLGAIAMEKAGILKRSRPAVSGVIDDEPRRAILRIAALRRCPVRELGRDFRFEAIPPARPLHRPSPGSVTVRTWRTDWGTFTLPLLGRHQAHNAAVALATLDVLAEQEPTLAIGREAVARGFASLRWPARVEVLGESPWIVVDGAHNVASAEALAETLRDYLPEVRRTLVFGTTRDKDLRGQLRSLLPLFQDVIATRYRDNPRSVPLEDVAAAVLDLSGRPAATVADPAEAIELARRQAGGGGLVCVTGSLFLAAEARAALLGLEEPRPQAAAPR
ncbi:bifunctional folylpolyglutamate synthase/dihydrofolate synthase [Aquisphaera insulae]|uniref:bifunctional folylpolyglutamate synthase/dihydrofolate synthase n=1 Tax=Aquisphaera insulae TaxID=2712864 RepID=UPI0013ECAA0A|nr:folylpolyglutamate synthase/dihydrofolate synthase family protein [Aquisphaera insulae]